MQKSQEISLIDVLRLISDTATMQQHAGTTLITVSVALVWIVSVNLC